MQPSFSRYYYRRDYWVEQLNNEQELWRSHAPYVVDFIDNLADIDRRHKRVFEERGMIVTDLESAP